MKKNTPVLMIGLDAAELSLIERLCSEGKLPTLHSLREQGCFGPLDANATIFTGGVWPTFYTSKEVAWHGIYHNKLWRYENMRCEVASNKWLPQKPFWEILDQNNYKIAAIDVPMTLGVSKLRNGIHLAGWGTHDLIIKGSWPPDLWKQVEREFGSPVIPLEYYGPQSSRTLLHLRDTLIKGTEQMLKLVESLIVREPWNLFFVVFGATHRGGHYLWNLSQIDKKGVSSEILQRLNNALIDIYQVCDYAIGRLIERVSKDARILVFSVHGMGPNPGWSDRCGEILIRIQEENEDTPAKSGFLYKLKQALPWQLIRQVTTRLPQKALDRLVTLWSANMFDWRTTRYFPLPMDHAGYLRINVRGREPKGNVEPVHEYDTICKELEEAFLSFRDIKTGKAIVEQVYRMSDLAPQDAPYREVLPDLVIKWNDVSATESDGIRSERYGEIHWNADGKLPSGRSGNHQERGWFVAVGNGICSATRVAGHRALDLVPTVFEWLGAKAGVDFQGKSIPALYGKEGPL